MQQLLLSLLAVAVVPLLQLPGWLLPILVYRSADTAESQVSLRLGSNRSVWVISLSPELFLRAILCRLFLPFSIFRRVPYSDSCTLYQQCLKTGSLFVRIPFWTLLSVTDGFFFPFRSASRIFLVKSINTFLNRLRETSWCSSSSFLSETSMARLFR